MARSEPEKEAPPGQRPPATGPRYGIPFGRVWNAALATARGTSRWTVTHADPVRGEIVVEVRPLLRATGEARIRVALDDLGFTRVDASFYRPTGERAEGARARQIARFYRVLERRLAADAAR